MTRRRSAAWRSIFAAAAAVAIGGCDDYERTVAATSPCPDTRAYFEEHVWGPLMAERCTSCHREGGVAGHTRLVLRDARDGGDWLDHNLRVASQLAALRVDGHALLRAKPSGRAPGGHTGGALIAPGSAEDEVMAAFVARAGGSCGATPEATCEADEEPYGPRLLRRLSHAEYRRTVRDLLGVDPDVLDGFAPDDVVAGFANNAGALRVSGIRAEHYRDAAERLASVATSSRLDALWPCALEAADRECAAEFIATVGFRAFRRPLSEGEIADYLGIYEMAAEDGVAQGVEWTLAALLQSPHFLYRTELGVRDVDGEDAFTLTAWEIASALSYLFWGTMPDERLFEAAARGELADQDGRDAQIDRLIADPRADAVVHAFVREWLGLDQLAHVTRDAATYPELTDGIRAAMVEETERLVAGMLRDGATLADLFEADHTWVTPALATYYGLALDDGGDAERFERVELEGTHRGGLLTQGAVLATHALPTSSSPIHRGKLVRERLLCQELAPPPPNLFASPPAPDPAKSTRERYQQHAADDACVACHRLIDPIGFGLEHFDGAGRFRTADGAHPVEARGEVVDLGGGDAEFVGADGLASVLAESDEARRCYLRQWARFGYGVDEGGCRLRPMASAFEAEDGRLAAALTVLAEAPRFVQRRGGPGELDTPAIGELVWEEGPGGGEMSPDDPDAPPPDRTSGAVVVDVQETSRWDGGYCVQVDVRNDGAEPVTWEVALDTPGTITNLCSAQVTPLRDGRGRFVGEAYNATLPAQRTTNFGWCAHEGAR